MAQAARADERGRRGLYAVATRSHDSPAPAAVPFEPGLSSKSDDLRELLSATPEQIAEQQDYSKRDLEATEKAAAILRKGGANAYDKALKALPPDSRDWWPKWVEEEEYQANAEGLAAFINDHLLPACIHIEWEVRYHQAIKVQTLGEGCRRTDWKS